MNLVENFAQNSVLYTGSVCSLQLFQLKHTPHSNFWWNMEVALMDWCSYYMRTDKPELPVKETALNCRSVRNQAWAQGICHRNIIFSAAVWLRWTSVQMGISSDSICGNTFCSPKCYGIVFFSQVIFIQDKTKLL